MDELIFESQQRIKWYINGIGIHCLTPTLFSKIPTIRLCEIYNVDLSYFKLKK